VKNGEPSNNKKGKTTNKTRTKVVIMGQEYVVRGAYSGEEIRSMAEYVDHVMQETRRRNPYLPLNKLAVLASLNICEELFRIKHDYESLLQALEDEQKK